jgi:hypothetical protein
LEVDDELLLLVGEVAALDSRPEVVGPPQPAALAAPHQPCTHTHGQKKSSQSTKHGSLKAIRCQLVKSFAREKRTGVDRHGAPVPGAVLLDVGDEHEVLLRRPRPLLHAHLVAARRPPHADSSSCLLFLSRCGW